MQILTNVVIITEHSKRKTVTVTDVSSPFAASTCGADKFKVIYALRRMGTPVYGFEGMGGSKKTTLNH
jgi:histone H4